MTTERAQGETVVTVSAETMGSGNDHLGRSLMTRFLHALATAEHKPDAVVFYNAAVRLLEPGSAHLDSLGVLKDAGVDLLACATSAEFFAGQERLALGRTCNMREIVQRLMAAEKVVTI